MRAPAIVTVALAFTLAALMPGAAHAQSTSTSSANSPYEKAKILQALRHLNATIEPVPEGKTVEGVDIVPLEVIEEEDPAPRLLNVFHTTTRHSILAREVLLDVGEHYRQYRVDETVRSLRTFQQLSLVLAIPTRGRTPGSVRIILVTKDVWSLRTNLDLKLGAGGLDLLRFEPTERNLGGTLESVITRFELYPKTLTLGGGYLVPRLGGRRLYLVADGNVVINRDSGNPEGSFGLVGVSTPQLSADTPWLWGASTAWANVYARRYVGAKLATFDAVSTPEEDPIPDVFHVRNLTTAAGAARSFGRAYKLDVTVGGELNRRSSVGLDPNDHDPRVVAEYQQKRVPTSDSRAAPWVQLRAYESRFLRTHDFHLLGLQEDYRVGYDTWIRAYPVTRALGSTRDFVGVQSAAQYIQPLLNGFVRATGEVLTELQVDGVPTFAVAANVAIVSPSFTVGRLVVDGVAISRPRNYLNQRSSIGGEGRLRGYPSAAFLGENLIAYNVELRSRPVEILACQVGSALFFDIGDAYDGNVIRPKSSTGFGLRALFPQLDRRVFRFDIAFPLVRGGGEGPIGFYLAFEQAFFPGAVSPPGWGPAQAILQPQGGALGQ